MPHKCVQTPEGWYKLYIRSHHPELALVGMRVLSQVVSASSCERNWSAHGHIHSEVRNRLAPATTEKLVTLLVYIYSNQKAVVTVAAAPDDELKMFTWDNEWSCCARPAVQWRGAVALGSR